MKGKETMRRKIDKHRKTETETDGETAKDGFEIETVQNYTILW